MLKAFGKKKEKDILEKFALIQTWYEQYDEQIKEQEGRPYFRTSHGLWGAAGMLDVFEFFLKADLDRFTFADYGSGDGRIVLIAALFTKALGLEGAPELTAIAQRAKKELKKEIPELERASFLTKDYYTHTHNDHDILFFFPDHPFPQEFQHALKKDFTGYVLVYNKIHAPELLRKGKTYWVQQVPIVSYPINRPEEDLFASIVDVYAESKLKEAE